MTMKKSMRRRRSPALVLIPIALAFFFEGVAQAAPDENSPSNLKWKNGAEVYAKICAHCHENGRVGPRILNRQLPPAYVRAVVRKGIRAMPPFRSSEIDDESLAKLEEYISKSQNTW